MTKIVEEPDYPKLYAIDLVRLRGSLRGGCEMYLVPDEGRSPRCVVNGRVSTESVLFYTEQALRAAGYYAIKTWS